MQALYDLDQDNNLELIEPDMFNLPPLHLTPSPKVAARAAVETPKYGDIFANGAQNLFLTDYQFHPIRVCDCHPPPACEGVPEPKKKRSHKKIGSKYNPIDLTKDQ